MGSALIALLLFASSWPPSLTFARALEEEGDLSGALWVYRREILPRLPDDSLKLDLALYVATLLAELYGPDSARAFLRPYCAPFGRAASFRQMWARLSEPMPRVKDPRKGLLFALFPGGGYLYCGHRADAANALRMHGILGFGLTLALWEHRPLAAGVYGTLLGLFYLGNLWGGYRCAKERNRLAWWRRFSESSAPPRRGPLPFSPRVLSLKRRAFMERDPKAFRSLMRLFADQGDFFWGFRYARLFAARFPGTESEAWSCYFLLGLGAAEQVLQQCTEPKLRRAAERIQEGGRKYLWLSALVPGSGLLAQGFIKDGLVSLGLNALTAYAAVQLFREGHPVDALLVSSLLGVRFYFGGLALTRTRYRERWLRYARPASP